MKNQSNPVHSVHSFFFHVNLCNQCPVFEIANEIVTGVDSSAEMDSCCSESGKPIPNTARICVPLFESAVDALFNHIISAKVDWIHW
jgi:hypothetical protein